MKKVLLAVIGCGCLLSARGETNQVFALWSNGAPGALGNSEKDIPTLTVYLPEASKASGAAMVICPGGGYGMLAPHEGVDYARFLNEQGICGFVLKYRLGSAGYRHPVMLQDAARAVRTVRARASEWNIDPGKIGIMGSSAGGHLASTLLTHFDAGHPGDPDPIERESSRPSLGILCYAVITMGEFTHEGSKANLLGKDPSPEQVRDLSNELQVTKDTPRTFIWHTWEDNAVPVENSLQFAAALRKAGVPFDLHIYQKGQHGIGLGSNKWDPEHRHPWTQDCVFWLKAQGFVK
ncbi:MAG TPA: alpha/beta hydrolase [Patescibacteria group bacterium]|nr:alpha/beta hydrolase [Patescibacteria group bacterium]